ncbi:small basic protein 1-like [Coturnix japonica]|uniref:Uncharacterized protein n=1 Tax=Coturnix japonica TaxID=93934 RepID=A0A8C2TPJ7_COTJA|nr:small basic protein 1-like [Coturnix japonica]
MKLLCVLFAVLLLFSMAVPGYGQYEGACKGFCASVCGKRDEWTFRRFCKNKYCCLPPPKKGK